MPKDAGVYGVLTAADLIFATLMGFSIHQACLFGGNFIFTAALSGFFFLVTTSTLIFCLFKKGKK